MKDEDNEPVIVIVISPTGEEVLIEERPGRGAFAWHPCGGSMRDLGSAVAWAMEALA